MSRIYKKYFSIFDRLLVLSIWILAVFYILMSIFSSFNFVLEKRHLYLPSAVMVTVILSYHIIPEISFVLRSIFLEKLSIQKLAGDLYKKDLAACQKEGVRKEIDSAFCLE